MTILIIDTYDRATFESLSPFTEETLGDRTEFRDVGPEGAEILKNYVANGLLPSERQPTDTFVVTDDHVIVTFTWNDLAAAEAWQARKKVHPFLVRAGLINTELVER